VDPTPEQVRQVQANLANMQRFNDFIYAHGQTKILNAYLLTSRQDSSDPGVAVVLNLLSSAFSVIGSEFGPAGNFITTFVSGMLSSWTTNTPPDLTATFASLLTRLDATSRAIDAQLARFNSDVGGEWSTKFTFNGATMSLSDLASESFPAESDPRFAGMANRALFGLDQEVWRLILTSQFVITFWLLSTGDHVMEGSRDEPPISWNNRFIEAHPAYYHTWTWHDKSGCGDVNGWKIDEYNLGVGVSITSDGSLANEACSYLFIDSSDGVVINPQGLFPRATVFKNLGIRTTTHLTQVGAGGGIAADLSLGYLRAMKKGQTLGLLVEREGRYSVEQRVIQKAQHDPVFAADLAFRPREALEKFLGVRIPETVAICVVIESPRVFAVVVPNASQSGQ
jgi:hypothetical protein